MLGAHGGTTYHVRILGSRTLERNEAQEIATALWSFLEKHMLRVPQQLRSGRKLDVSQRR